MVCAMCAVGAVGGSDGSVCVCVCVDSRGASVCGSDSVYVC